MTHVIEKSKSADPVHNIATCTTDSYNISVMFQITETLTMDSNNETAPTDRTVQDPAVHTNIS